MRLLITLFLFYFGAVLPLRAQTGVLTYRIVHGIPDTLIRSSTAYKLVFSATESLDSAGEQRLVSKRANSSWQPMFFAPGKEPILYKNLETGRYLERRRGFKKTVVEDDTLPTIDWQFQKATRVIGGFTCWRAEGDVRGRRFVAWYAPDIPVTNGPWKLHGLPGLILAAEDTTRQVLIFFESLTIPAPANVKPGPFPEVDGQQHQTYEEYKTDFRAAHRKYAKLQDDNTPHVDDPNRTNWSQSTSSTNSIDFSDSVTTGYIPERLLKTMKKE
jgi:GLPGLI family protein